MSPSLDLPSVDVLLARMADTLGAALNGEALSDDVVMIGIHTGGLWLAEKLHPAMGLSTELGAIDITFYRDDFSQKGLHPTVKPSRITEPLDDRTVILVDDVLFTGRTIRAALNEIFDYGRPRRVLLAVLVERAGRQLPIAPDVVGTRLHALPDGAQVRLRQGDGALRLELVE